MSAYPSPRFARCLSLTVSAFALSVALAQPVLGQATQPPSSYNAGVPSLPSNVTATYTPGTVGVPGSPGSKDVYTIDTTNSSTAVLSFTPTDTATGGGAGNPINFQNPNTQVVYQNTIGGSEFTVLNRIVPADVTRPIVFNGTVTSQLQPAAGVPAVRGGSVWFYSPAGIILGDNSVFDVGSLLLSTADPTGGSGTIGSTTSFTLNSSNNPDGIINILSLAKINATNPNSYVAIVAPTVLQRGTINVNGAAAFVAAEQATLSFANGLFDISVTVGTDGANQGGLPLQLRGTVSLDRSSGAATNTRGIYAVAVPKNTAISMIVAPDGYYGFDVAQGATIQNGAVYLQAGGDLHVDPAALIQGRIQDIPIIPGAGISIQGSSDPAILNGGRFTAPVAARASDTIDVANQGFLVTPPFSGFTTPVSFLSDLAIYGGTSASVTAIGGTIAIGGLLDLQSFGRTTIGSATLIAGAGGIITVGTGAVVRAGYPAGFGADLTVFDFRRGGNASVNVSGGGAITAQQYLRVEAPGSGAAGQASLGGTADLTINGGSVTAQDIGVSAFANGTDSATTGGTAGATVANGQLTASQTIMIDGSASSPAGAPANGGTAQLTIGVGGVVSAGTQVQIAASAQGGDVVSGPGSGGNATAGTASLTMAATTSPPTSFTITGDLNILATARGGIGGSGTNSAGGTATGGAVTVDIGSGARLTANEGFLSSFGYGGASVGSTGGAGSGGTITVDTMGVLDFAYLSLSADAMGGDKTGGAGNAGDAASGRANLRISGGSVTAIRPTGNPSLLPGIGVGIQAIGGSVTGGTGSGGAGVAGGAVSGLGNASITIFNAATVTTARIGAFANGTGGSASGTGTGGFGRAANASILLQSDSPVLVDSVTIRSNAVGGAATAGAGGDATAGLAELNSAPSSSATGATTITGTIDMSANATGGNGLSGGGANASLVEISANGVNFGTNVGGAVTLASNALGGNGLTTDGSGGEARASTIRVDSAGGLALASTLTASASATGGYTVGGELNGGNATGGSIQLQASTGNLSVAGASSLSADAFSGSHGAGSGAAGDAVGGFIGFGANGGSLVLAGGATVSATGFGGVSVAAGGNAMGGSVDIASEVDADTGARGGTIAIDGLNVSIGANASQLQDQGRIGGAATGGAFTLLADTGAITLGNVDISAGAGGHGGSNPATTVMRGGSASIIAQNADLTINGTVYISAPGQAASVFNSNPPAGPGASIGGSVSILAAAGHSITVNGGVNVGVDAISGRSSLRDVAAGSGTGGQISVTATGTIRISGNLALSSEGQGGNVFGLSSATGGEGHGGSIDVAVTGLLDVANGIGAAANGRGGTPLTGDGGAGYGGFARIRATQSGTIRTSTINIAADGNGSFGANGGAGFGGVTSGSTLGGAYLIASGGTITGSTGFTITANGSGGGGVTGNGGAGTGGQAWIVGMNGTVDLSAGTSLGTLQADGTGGLSLDNAGTGGSGIGGQVLIGRSTVGANQGATSTGSGRILFGDVLVDASGLGARGGTGVAGGQGGAGGAGVGGVAEVSADAAFGGLAANAGTTLTVTVGGVGGAGGDGGTPGGSTGIGGAGTGGSAFVGTADATGSDPTTGSATFANVALDATGTGGGGSTGGAGRGGSLTFASTGATVTASNVAMLAGGAGGSGGGTGTGGTATIGVAGRANGLSRGSLTQAGTIAIDTSATSTGGATIAGASAFTVNGGDATVGLYAVTNAGTTPSATAPRIGATGGLLAASAFTVQAIGDFTLATGAGGRVQAGSALLQATGALTFTDSSGASTAPGSFSVANDLTVIVGGDYRLDGPLGAGGVYSVTSGGTIATGAVTGGRGVAFTAANGITTGAIASGTGSIALTARTGGIATGNVQAGGNVALLAKTGIATGGIAASRATGGYVLLADAANAGAIDITATGVAIAGPVTVGGPVSAAILRTSTTGTATFGGAIDVAQFARIAAADISLAGTAIGPDLAFSSGNIRLGANGSIGDANTQTAAFTVTGGGPAFLGGTSDGSGYTLDASELSRVRSTNVSFNAGPSLAVRDATLSGSGAGASANITGANGALTLASSGTISVTGNLRFASAGAGQSVVLNAGAVRLFTDTGSIGVFGTGDTLGGRLAISANSIEAGTAQLLGSRTSFAGPLGTDVTAAIGAAAAQPRDAGILQAGRIELAARDDIIIQNTGTAALAAGFSAGSGGLAITNRGGTTAAGGFNVLIYGRVQGTSGFLTNTDTPAAVSFASAQGTALAGYSTQSVVNGCAIVGGASCTVETPVVTAPPVAPPIAAIVRDVIDGNLITISRDTVQLPSFDQPAAIDLSFLQTPLVITDPVASAGNPILWESSGAMSSTGPAGPATGKKQIDEDRRRRAAYGGQAR
jgi:filamentous hemagglutinin family protein